MASENEPLMMDKSDDKNYCRTTSCIADPQVSILECLKDQRLTEFSDSLTSEGNDSFNVNHVYEEEGFKTLVQIAIELEGHQLEFLKLLLQAGASVDELNDYLETTALHVACARGDYPALQLLLRCSRNEFDINVKDGNGSTPLHLAVERLGEDLSINEINGCIKCVRALLDVEGIEVNEEDLRGGQTALYYAAVSGSVEAVRLLASRGGRLDHVCNGKTVRELIVENIPSLDPKDLESGTEPAAGRPLKSVIFDLIEREDFGGFSKALSEAPGSFDLNGESGAGTPLQCCAESGLAEFAKVLLDKGADPNRVGNMPQPPLVIAAGKCYHEVVRVLLDDPRTNVRIVEKHSKRTVLHSVMKRESAPHQIVKKSASCHEKCIGILLDESRKSTSRQVDDIINYQDQDGNTALHYATQQTCQNIIKSLLKRGANMGIKNNREKTPISSILPDTMREFLDDECIKSNGIITDEKFELTFKYNFLTPPIIGEEAQHAEEGGAGKLQDGEVGDQKHALPETEPLWYLSQTSLQHRALLRHPVIASFLWMKWQRIRWYFYFNLLAYLIFVTSLTAYIFVEYGGNIRKFENRSSEAAASVDGDSRDSLPLIYIVTILASFLALREVFQMGISFKRYVLNFENVIEIVIIVLTFVVLHEKDSSEEDILRKRHICAVLILMSWTELILLIGRHPQLSTYVTMFTTVLWTFFYFLTWYSLFVIAFALSFYIMFHKDVSPSEPVPEDDYPFFDYPWLTIVKTSAMFVGELEFADIPFTDSVVSYIIFITFIFLIVVVLMNLLNGLAVSDTGLIRDEAETVGFASRVELISYTESMLLGDPFAFLANWPAVRWLRKLPSCAFCHILYRIPLARDVLRKITGGTGILLFYSCLPHKEATFYPNKRSKNSLFLPYSKNTRVSPKSAPDVRLYVSEEILDSAKSKVLEKQASENANEELSAQISEMNTKLQKIDSLEEKLNSLINMLSKSK